jgi:uncharacterized membrane protein (DUF106 family)
MLTPVLNAIFGPVLNFPPIVAIAIFSFIITLMTSLIYKFTTDQNKLKQIKTKMKAYQQQIKELKDQPEEALKVQKKSMELSMQQMQQTMKSTIWTIIPVLIIFGWLNTHMGFYPIMPGQEFSVYAEFKDGAEGLVTLDVLPNEEIEFISENSVEIQNNRAEWTLKGPEGKYIMTYTHDGQIHEQDLLITEKREYAPPIKQVNKNNFISGNIVNEKVMPLQFIGIKWGWLGTYIIFSIVFGMTIRKALGVN